MKNSTAHNCKNLNGELVVETSRETTALLQQNLMKPITLLDTIINATKCHQKCLSLLQITRTNK